MEPEKIITLLKEHGSFHEGHFVLTNGCHSNFYIDCATILRKPKLADVLGDVMADRLKDIDLDIVVGPADNAVPFALMTALALYGWNKKHVLNVIASKGERRGTFVFKRGADKELNGKSIAVVEDLWSTGGSTKSVIEEIRKCGGTVVAAGAIVNRGNVTAGDIGDVGHFFSLCKVNGVPHTPTDDSPCPWCEARIPMRTDYGHGAEWCEKHPDYPVAD